MNITMQCSSGSTKKLKSSAEGTTRDRLSELPDEVVVNILSFLPTIEAVRTLLLRRFGNLWTQIHSLHFSDSDFTYDSGEDDESPFSDFVSNVLTLHSRPAINKFHLHTRNYNPKLCVWIRFALCRGVKELTLEDYDSQDSILLSGNVFVSESLVSLTLQGFEIKCPIIRVSLGSLRKLTLFGVGVDDNMLILIISGSPSLEELNIIDCSELENVCIVSSSLKMLILESCSWELRTLDCPNLKHLITISEEDPLILPSHAFISESLVSIELMSCKIEHLDRVHLGSVTKLKLESVTLDDQMLKEIICGCPCLEELHIDYLKSVSLCITSPSLKILKLGSSFRTINCPNLNLLDISSLNEICEVGEIDVSSHCEVKIQLSGLQFSEGLADKFFSFLGKFGNALLLNLTSGTVDQLAYFSMKELALPHKNRWKHLILEIRIHRTCILGICRLLRELPYLEELSIYAHIPNCYHDKSTRKILDTISKSNMLVQELSSPCVLPQLNVVTFNGFEKPHESLIQQLVKFIHKSAVNLEKLIFVYKKGNLHQ